MGAIESSLGQVVVSSLLGATQLVLVIVLSAAVLLGALIVLLGLGCAYAERSSVELPEARDDAAPHTAKRRAMGHSQKLKMRGLAGHPSP